MALSESGVAASVALAVLRERREYLLRRIVAKQRVGWEYADDEREAAALTWALGELAGGAEGA